MDRIEIIIQLLSWLFFVICGFIKNFLPNSYFILQIYHAKNFKMKQVMSPYFNFSVWYFIECFKNLLLVIQTVCMLFWVRIERLGNWATGCNHSIILAGFSILTPDIQEGLYYCMFLYLRHTFLPFLHTY